jgi:hypothetical protein
VEGKNFLSFLASPFFIEGHLSKLTRKKKYKPCVSVLCTKKAEELPWENEFSSLLPLEARSE